MTVKIIPSAEFDRQFKRLAKKYKSLLDDYLTFSPSRWDRYLGMTAAMTQVPVPTASNWNLGLIHMPKW